MFLEHSGHAIHGIQPVPGPCLFRDRLDCHRCYKFVMVNVWVLASQLARMGGLICPSTETTACTVTMPVAVAFLDSSVAPAATVKLEGLQPIPVMATLTVWEDWFLKLTAIPA